MSYSKLVCIGNIGSIKKNEEKLIISVADNISENETVWYSCFFSRGQTARYLKKLKIGDRVLIEGRVLPIKVSEKGQANIRLLTNYLTVIHSKKETNEFTANEIPF